MSLKIKITAESNPEDIVRLNMPAFIRCLEVAREEIKSDNELHAFVENVFTKQTEEHPIDSEDVALAEEESNLSGD